MTVANIDRYSISVTIKPQMTFLLGLKWKKKGLFYDTTFSFSESV